MSSGRPVVLSGIILSVLGCSEQSLLVPAEGETLAALFAIQSSGERRLQASKLTAGTSVELPIETGDLVFALLFSESLEQLGLAPGDVPLASTNEPYSRALPPTPRVFSFDHDHETFQPATSEQIESLHAFRIRDLTPNQCISKGGCYGVTDPSRCTMPCPAASAIEAPRFEGEPDQPAPPVFTPCPEGWQRVVSAESDHPESCEPFPLGAERSCGPFEAWFPGDSGCSIVGDPCPSGEWPDGLPTSGAVVYVKADAPPGGDGTRAAPHQTIGDAIAELSLGGTVALAAGDYRESLVLSAGVGIVGVCVERTAISAPSALEPVIRVRDGSIVNLRLVGGDTTLVGEVGSRIDLRGVIIQDTAGLESSAISIAEGAILNASEVLVRRSAGRGITASSASIELNRLVMNGMARVAIRARSSRATMSDIFIDGLSANAIWADGTSVVRVERFVLHPSVDHTILLEKGARGQIEDGVLRGSPAVEGERHRIGVRDGAELGGSRLRLEPSERPGMFVHRSTVALSDLWIGTTEHLAFWIGASSSVALDRTRIDDTASGPLIYMQQGTVRISDLHVVRSVPFSSEFSASGIRMSELPNRLDLRRARIEGPYNTSVWTTASNHVDVSDLTVVGAVSGFEVDASSLPPGEINARRVLVQGPSEMGFLIGGSATIEDARIQGSEGGAIGISSQGELAVTLERIDVQGGHGFGLQVSNAFTSVTARDLRILNTRRQSCGSFLSSDDCLGSAVSALKGARLDVERFVFGDNVIGVSLLVDVLGQTGEVDLVDGIIEGSETAVLASHPDYALERLFQRVVLRDNDRLVDRAAP